MPLILATHWHVSLIIPFLVAVLSCTIHGLLAFGPFLVLALCPAWRSSLQQGSLEVAQETCAFPNVDCQWYLDVFIAVPWER